MKLRQYLVKRVIHMIITLLIVLVLLFVIYRIMPGSTAATLMMKPGMTPTEVNEIKVRYGFSKWIPCDGEFMMKRFSVEDIGHYSATVTATSESGQSDSFSTNFDVDAPLDVDFIPPRVIDISLENQSSVVIGSPARIYAVVSDVSGIQNIRMNVVYPNHTIAGGISVPYMTSHILYEDPDRADAGNFTYYYNSTTENMVVGEDGSTDYSVTLEVSDFAKNKAVAAFNFDVATQAVTSRIWEMSSGVQLSGGIYDYPVNGQSIPLSARVLSVNTPSFSIIAPNNDSTPVSMTGTGLNNYYTGSYVANSNGKITLRIEVDGIVAYTSFPVNSAVTQAPSPVDDDDALSPLLSDLFVTYQIGAGDTLYPFKLTGTADLEVNATALNEDGERYENVSAVSVTIINPDGTISDASGFLRHTEYIADRSMAEQFFIYMKTMLVFDFGTSFQYNKPTWGLILERIPSTALLFGTSMVLAYIIGIIIGVIIAWRRGSALELGTIIVTLFFYSMPIFWFALILQWVFYAELHWFPLAGGGGIAVDGSPLHGITWFLDVLWHLFMPLVTLTILSLAGDILLMRSCMLEVIGEDYITTAKAKGLKERTVIYKHAARNAMLPVVTAMAMHIGAVISGGVLTETIFSWYGMGSLLINATFTKDFPVVQGAFYILALMTILGNMAADILYAYLDPRVQL
jgi:peptide/nickel transport system permease protein